MIKRNKTRISLFRKEIRAARWRKLPAALTDTVEHSYSFLGISRAKVLWIKFVSMWFCIGMSIRMGNGFSIYHNICRTSLPWSPRQAGSLFQTCRSHLATREQQYSWRNTEDGHSMLPDLLTANPRLPQLIERGTMIGVQWSREGAFYSNQA